ncbi:MAG: FAD-binding oxidoreductase [Gemmatimonadaceae bacterium]
MSAGTFAASSGGDGAVRYARQVGDVLETVRAAAEDGTRLRVAGRGTWLDAGWPVQSQRTLALAGLTGVVDYVPGDFTLTARAGTTLREIAALAAREGQWLALDPFGSPDGTLGATVATASAGPLAHAFGTPRDNVLGMEVVTGTAQVVRAGGRVVKNVAGFDLTRLFTGSWGTLGAITEITVRMRAEPEVSETYALALDERPDALAAFLRALREAPLVPYALELMNGKLAERLALAPTACLLARLGGNADAVRAQRATLAKLGAVTAAPAGVWSTLRACEPAGAAVMRFGRRPSQLAALWNEVRQLATPAEAALMHATVGRGLVRCVVPPGDDDVLERLTARDASLGGSRMVERVPAHLWHRMAQSLRVPAEGETTRPAAGRWRLMRGVKDAYDPAHVLNPGIMGEAIA